MSVRTDPYARHILFGAAYYHEYQPYERLKIDLDLIREADFNVVRVGESVWATWEPSDGVFDVDWLEVVLEEAHARGIAVILGTPTYAIPPWLHRKHPEVMAERRSGVPVPFGARQNVDYRQPAFRFHAERIVREIVKRYADHPAVIGYQVDNEPGVELPHNASTFAGFKEYLKERFASVEELNRSWGLTYWSHRLACWDDLWRPDGNTNPGFDLAWRRYQAANTADFIAWQAGIVRELARDDQFITTCFAYGRPAVHPPQVASNLDIAAVNPYYAMQDALAMPPVADAAPPPAWRPANGLWWPAFESDLAWGLKESPFLVTETNATSIGESHYNYPAYDGQWRQCAYLFLARGARMIEYWHWHTLHFGTEMYWGGILGHALEPGRCYGELARTASEIKNAGAILERLLPDSDIAMLWSQDSRWACEFSPPIAHSGTNEPDRAAYDSIFTSYYRGCFLAGRQVAIIDSSAMKSATAAQIVERWPVLIVPAMYVASDEELTWLLAYAEAGGHLVLGFRSGYLDKNAQARHSVMPGILRKAVGAHYLEYTNLHSAVRISAAATPGLEFPSDACASAWADGLIVDTAAPLVTYRDRHLSRWPAITTNSYGAGQVTYVGTLLDDAASAALARWLVPQPRNHIWSDRPSSVTAMGATNASGQRIHFVSNWSDEEVALPVRIAIDDIAEGAPRDPGTTLRLGPWDVHILVERNAS